MKSTDPGNWGIHNYMIMDITGANHWRDFEWKPS